MSDEQGHKKCFVILPFAGEFEDIFYYGIQQTVQEFNYLCIRVDEEALVSGGSLLIAIIKEISSADLVIADLSEPNPNIYYELGIVHTLGTPLIMISRKGKSVAFDIRDRPMLIYESIGSLKSKLKKWIAQIVENGDLEARSSPVFEAVPSLDQVPRSELTSLQSEVEDLKGTLRQREQELASIKSSGTERGELAALRSDIRNYLSDITEEVFARHTKDLAATIADANKLAQENERLRGYEQELRQLREMTLVNPHWSGRNFEIEPDLCFLLMPFSEPWSDDAWNLINSVVESCNMRCRRADEQEGRVVMDDLWEGINKARVVIADLTGKNPNVTYEVGLADVIGKDVILLSQTPKDVPFDFLGMRLITYENSIGGVRKLTEELRKRLERLR